MTFNDNFPHAIYTSERSTPREQSWKRRGGTQPADTWTVYTIFEGRC